MSNYFSLHTHSHFSTLDAMESVPAMVAKAAAHGHAAMGLTDHGNMSGAYQLYRECKKHGMLAFPGLEAYVVHDVGDKKAKRYHLTMAARTPEGFRTLVKLCTKSQTRPNFHLKPRVDFNDLAEIAEAGLSSGLIVSTGCHFGLVCQAMLAPGQTYEDGKAVAKTISEWFPHTYVELQHHGIGEGEQESDDLKVSALVQVAHELSLPMIATQDCHYCDAEQAELHSFMKQLAYGSIEGEGDEFPGDGYFMADKAFVSGHYSKKVWAECEAGYKQLLDSHKLRLPFLDTYRFHVPKVGASVSPSKGSRPRLAIPAQRTLRKATTASLAALVGIKNRRKYEQALEYELGVIDGLGFASYFLLVADYCNAAREAGIFINARGSANGSLVCWLMKITDIDPIEEELDFDRFLTPDRERPPDIDMDVEDTGRAWIVDYIKKHLEVVQIGTYGKLGVDEEGRGGLFVSYMGSRRRAYPDKEEFKRRFGHVKSALDLPKLVQRKLDELAELTIYKSPGAHAAGFAIGTREHPIAEWLPTMLIPSSDTTVTQMMMDDVEDAGFIKVDLLGLRSLRMIRRTLEMIGKEDWYWIPKRDSATAAFLRKGRTETGVFQLEGYTAAKGCRQVKIRDIYDCVLVNALYRPATINAGHVDTYLAVRHGEQQVSYIHPFLEPILKTTYGVPVYQEQIIAILRAIGFTSAEFNKMLKAIKASNEKIAAAIKTFESLHKRFDECCADTGLDPKQTARLWSFIATFSDYSFNKSHATGYGFLGWRMAYLKVHHPLEFHTALLETTAGTPKESIYLREVRRCGVTIRSADVNRSGMNWTADSNGVIRRGLVSIKGIGVNAAQMLQDNQPYSSIEDLIERTEPGVVTGGKKWTKDGVLNGVLGKLQETGALRSLGVRGSED